MNIPCEVIRDLLPLYHDEVCSIESKSLIEDHLKTCKSCLKELDYIRQDMNVQHIEPENENAAKAITTAWKKATKKSMIKGIVIATIICLMLIVAFVGLTQWKFIPVSSDVLKVSELSELQDGCVVFHLYVDDNKELRSVKYTISDDGSFYLTPMHSIFEKKA